MALVVIRPGVATTVQDRGRAGFRALGVPPGGAFDRASLDLANALLGNDPDAAALEMTLVGGQYRATVPLALALAGAPMAARIVPPSGADRPLVIPQSFSISPGEILDLGGAPAGARAYLAARGGWQTPVVLGSRSGETRLSPGDVLPAEPGQTPSRRPSAWPWAPTSGGMIRVIDGPDARPGGPDASWLERSSYQVSPRADRMGLRLDGPPLPIAAEPDRPSMAVAPGAVQVAGGRPILLGVAGGTMGGYPHPAHVISADLDRLAQLRPGDEVRFLRVSLAEARALDRVDRAARSAWLARIAAMGRTS